MKIHPSAIIEEGVEIGEGSSVWDNVHIRQNARLGRQVIVGEKSYIAYDVKIGDNVKINAFVYICAGVSIGEMCMISAGVVFTNDLYPRAMNRDLTAPETSEPTEETLRCEVRKGVTIGAQATIGPGVTLGEFSMIGMGSVVTRDVPPHALVFGNPARVVGHVCVCGPRLVRQDDPPAEEVNCERCGRSYQWTGNQLQSKASQ